MNAPSDSRLPPRWCLEFRVLGEPVGKKRARVTRHGTYTPRETLEYEEQIRWEAVAALRGTGLRHLLPNAKSMFWLWIEISASTRHTDGDNIEKSVQDALNGVVWVSDSQVTMVRHRRWKASPKRPWLWVKLGVDVPWGERGAFPDPATHDFKRPKWLPEDRDES